MCNFVHKERVVPRRKAGTGYKLFLGLPGLATPFQRTPGNDPIFYQADEDGWVRWKPYLFSKIPNSHAIDEAGFCIFPNKKEAIGFAKTVGKDLVGSKLRLSKVRYRKAVSRQTEKFFHLHKYNMLIVKEFKPI